MGLEIHRRDEATDAEIRISKVFPKWLTADQYETIPRQEAESLAQLLIAVLPEATLAELTRSLAMHRDRA